MALPVGNDRGFEALSLNIQQPPRDPHQERSRGGFRTRSEQMKKTDEKKVMKTLRHEEGVTYYSRETERRVFFILTIAMLIMGILYKIGWL